ncbi:hypothetical protein GCM10010428_55410 [Actinosynnema pretiosum subsp. pretiosum]
MAVNCSSPTTGLIRPPNADAQNREAAPAWSAGTSTKIAYNRLLCILPTTRDAAEFTRAGRRVPEVPSGPTGEGPCAEGWGCSG